MGKTDKILEFNKYMMEATIPFDKLPGGLKESTLEYVTFRRELAKESDRGCALLAAAHIDYLLLALLTKKLLGDKTHFDTIFGFNGPLGTFSSKILMCYSIGLISKDALHDIQIIRKIRNEFGHTPSIIDFSNPKIRAQCDRLKHNAHDEKAGPKSKFLNVVSGLTGQIQAKTRTNEKFVEEPNLDLKRRKENFEKIMDLLRKYVNEEKL